MLADPSLYELSGGEGSIELDANSLVQERKKLKQEMAKIVAEVTALSESSRCDSFKPNWRFFGDNFPEKATTIEPNNKIAEPELWATRLPVCSNRIMRAKTAKWKIIEAD